MLDVMLEPFFWKVPKLGPAIGTVQRLLRYDGAECENIVVGEAAVNYYAFEKHTYVRRGCRSAGIRGSFRLQRLPVASEAEFAGESERSVDVG